jgi:hypothetical protein
MLLHSSLLRSERPRRYSPSRHPRPTFTTLVHSIMATDDLPGDVSDDSWDTGHAALPMDWIPTAPRTFPQYTRPFEPWSDIARDYPGHLEVVRFQRQREQDRAFMWTRRRSHASCDKAIPREGGLDAIYLRQEGERAYCEGYSGLAPRRYCKETLHRVQRLIESRGLWCSRSAGQRTLGKDGGNGLPGRVRLYIVEIP